jgi:hypothetical protein
MMLFFTTLSAQQSGGYPENYFNILHDDIAKVSHKSFKKTEISGLPTVSSMEISGIDKGSFPKVTFFSSVLDSSGNHIEGLDSSSFDLYVKHEDEKSVLGTKLSSFDVEEIGAVESKADIVFVIDSTGSMSSQISTVKDNVIAFVNKLVDNNISYRLAGFDYGDEVPYRSSISFTDDADSFKSWVSGLYAHGGDDWPENPLDSIISAGYLDFRADAQQIIVLITDAPAHVAGDGGDSKTSATFSATASAIGSKTFYYFSNDTSYLSLGSQLGGTNFSADTLISKLSSGITGKYLISFTDPIDKKDGLKRKIRFVHKATGVVTSGEYQVDEASVTLSGDVTNNDTDPLALEGVRVEFTNTKTKKTFTVLSDSDGKYKLDVPIGEYIVSASLIEYKTTTLDLNVEEETSSVDTIVLPRASIADEKDHLIAEAKKLKAFGTTFSSPYADEADSIIAWVNTLPSKADGDSDDPTDAQKEGLKELIQSSIVLNTSNGYVTKDAEKLGGSVGEVIVGVLTLTGTFDKLQKQIRDIVAKLPDTDSFWYGWAVKAIKKTFNFVASKIGELSTSIANMVLDFVAVSFPEKDYPIVSNIITVTKDVISASDGKPASISVVTTKITPWVSKQVIIPFYTSGLETTLSDSLDRSKAITRADFDMMAKHINDSIVKLNEISNNFAKLQKSYDGLGTIKGYLTSIKNVLDVVHKLDPVVEIAEKVPVTKPYAIALDKSLAVMDKALEAGNVVVSGSTAVLSGNHLYHLSDDTKDAMSKPYGVSFMPTSADFISLYANSSETSKDAWLNYKAITSSPSINTTASVCGSSDIVSDFTNLVQDTIDNTIDKNNSIEDFANIYVDDIGATFDCVVAEFDGLKAKVDAGAKLTYGKPVNYDLLSKTAYTEYINLQNLSLSYALKITSIIVNSSMEATADGKFASSDTSSKEELKILLTEWSNSVSKTANALASAVNSVSSMISSKSIVIVKNVSADVDKVSDKVTSFEVSATLENISSVDAKDVTLTLNMPKELDVTAMSLNKSISSVIKKIDTVTTKDVNRTLPTISAGESIGVSWIINLSSFENIDKESLTFIVSSKDTSASGYKILVVPVEQVDTDEDGIPDSWEDKYGLDKNDPKDALMDQDDDGLNNLLEYRYGFNPTTSDNDLSRYLTIGSEDGIMKGDIDANNLIQVSDRDQAVSMWHKKYGDPSFVSNGDMNGNGYIDIEDIMLINAYSKK